MDTKQHLENLCDEYEKLIPQLHTLKNQKESLSYQYYYAPDDFEEYFGIILKAHFWKIAFIVAPILAILGIIFAKSLPFITPYTKEIPLHHLIFYIVAFCFALMTVGRFFFSISFGIVFYPIFKALMSLSANIKNNKIEKTRQKINSEFNQKIRVLQNSLDNLENNILQTINTLPQYEYGAAIQEIGDYSVSFLYHKVWTMDRHAKNKTLQKTFIFLLDITEFLIKEENAYRYDAFEYHTHRLEKIPNFYTKCILTKQLIEYIIVNYKKNHPNDWSGSNYTINYSLKIKYPTDLDAPDCYIPYISVTLTYSAPNGNYIEARSWL